MPKNKKNNYLDVKNRILIASEDLFATKGYDATSIEEIAKKADVTKSLIYYYFEGKEKILEELFAKHLCVTMNEKKEILSKNSSDVNPIEQSMLKGFEFLLTNKKIIRILLAEMLKDNLRNPSMCKMVEDMILASVSDLKSLGMDIKDGPKFTMYSFFFGLAPLIAYTFLGNAWIKNNLMDRTEFTVQFCEMMVESFSNQFDSTKGVFFKQFTASLNDNLVKMLED